MSGPVSCGTAKEVIAYAKAQSVAQCQLCSQGQEDQPRISDSIMFPRKSLTVRQMVHFPTGERDGPALQDLWQSQSICSRQFSVRPLALQ